MRLAAAIALLCLCGAASAGPLSFGHFIHTELEAKDGLPAQANSIVQTPDGYLWFATPDGLFRYNGQSFERIPVDHKATFFEPTIIEAIVSRRGEIWLALGQNSGVAVLRDGVLRQTGMASPPPQITHLVETPNGDIWAASSGKEKRLFRFSGGRWQQMDLALAMPQGAVADLECDRQGNIWVSLYGASGGRLAYLKPGAARFEIAEDKVTLGRLAIDRTGGLWISDTLGTRMLRDAQGRAARRPISYPRPEGIGFPRFRFDANGNIWGSSLSGGIFLIPDAANPVNSGTMPQTFAPQTGIGTLATLDVFPDREGNIWVSSSEAVHRFHPANAVAVAGIESRPSAPQRLAAAMDGSVYLFSLGKLYRIQPNLEPRLVADDLATSAVICPARTGGIWLLETRRTILFDNVGRRAFPGRPGSVEPVLCEEDGLGRLWSLAKGEVSWFRDGGWHDGFPGLGPIDVWDAATDPSGALVLSLAANRLLRITEDKAEPVEKSWVGSISSMRETPMGLLVSHANGLWRMQKSGRIDNIASRALAKRRDFDIDGEALWAYGIKGVEKIGLKELENSWGSERASFPKTVFDWSEGLPVGKQDTGYRGRQIVAGGDGRIWILTRAGPYVIDSRNFVRNAIPPPMKVRAIWANGHALPKLEQDVALPAGTRSVRIAYSALSYSSPERVQFRYRLVGTSAEWTAAGNRHEVTFDNLGPGDYRFEVAGANEDGVWNRVPAVIAFTILPTFVQSMWFKLGLALLVLAGIVFAYRWRTHVLAERIRTGLSQRSAERDRIARELHDTLLQSIQALILRFQLLVDQLPEGHPSRRDLYTSLDQADEVLIESRKRVLDLRAKQPRSDLKSVIASLAERQLPPDRFECEIRTSGDVVPIERTVFNALVDVANESLFNIVRHSQARSVTVDIRYSANCLELDICDDGVGFDAESIGKALTAGHFGLIGLRERIENVGGSCRLVTSPQQGVRIHIRIPGTIAFRTNIKHPLAKIGRGTWFARRAREPVE